MNENELMHYGVPGMKWGVRRYRNEDGSLTSAGKKKISKRYAKLDAKTQSRLKSKYNRMYVEAYNKTADDMNNGGIDKFNAQQEKKYGKNFTKRKYYDADYRSLFEKKLSETLASSVYDFYKSDKSFKKARALVDEYKMVSWDELARTNENRIAEYRRVFEGKKR